MDLIAGRVWADERRPIRHLDPVLLVTALLLAAAGLFLVYSATHQSLDALKLDPAQFVKKQFTAFVLGFVFLILVAAFDYRFYKVYAGFIYGAVVMALTLGTAFGPLSAGAVFDHAGTYAPFLMGAAIMTALAALALASLGRPHHYPKRRRRRCKRSRCGARAASSLR